MFKYIYVLFLLFSSSVHASTTLHVSVSTDNDPGNIGEAGDLRFCLNTMNQQLNSGPGDYAIVFDMPMTIQLNGILPIINNSSNSVNITIGNAGSTPTVTIDGQGTYPGFFTPMGNVTIQNITFQNLVARGGQGGSGISGGGGGMGAGGAIYAPQNFLNGSNPAITLMNVSINSCSAVGGNGGSYFSVDSPTGNEGGGGGGGFSGNGGSVTTVGSTGGAGGGGFGGNGGDATLSKNDNEVEGGGGGGGGGIGSRATIGTPNNLGNGGSDVEIGTNGNGYGLGVTAGSGAGGHAGGDRAGGGGGGGGIGATPAGGGGGGAQGSDGQHPQGEIPPGGESSPSGGVAGDGGGGGGGGVVSAAARNDIDGQAGGAGYGGGGGGGAGLGSSDTGYTVQGGWGGIGGGGGGGGTTFSSDFPAHGGDSLAGGGGGGGGPTSGSGGSDTGQLGGGAGGNGAADFGPSFGGGGGGGGSALGGAIFVDSGLTFTIQALSGIPTVFTMTNNTVEQGTGGSGGTDAGDGFDGTALGNNIFLRSASNLTLIANDADDLLTLGEQVSFVDDTSLGGGPTTVSVTGNGTIIYNGTTDYAGVITINNAHFKVNGTIQNAQIKVCRNIGFSEQRGKLSGSGSLTGDVSVNSGIISPDTGETLTLGSLDLASAQPAFNMLGSLTHIELDANGTSLVAVNSTADLAGILEIDVDPNTVPGSYTILTSAGITGTFDSIRFTGSTPNYSLSYLPDGAPTYVRFDFLGFLEAATNFTGQQKKNNFGLVYELYNQLTWTPSTSEQAAGYFLYRDGQHIATVLSAATSTYQDHNRPRNVSFEYSLVTFDSDGNESPSVTVTVS